jgi:hypothetical protein
VIDLQSDGEAEKGMATSLTTQRARLESSKEKTQKGGGGERDVIAMKLTPTTATRSNRSPTAPSSGNLSVKNMVLSSPPAEQLQTQPASFSKGEEVDCLDEEEENSDCDTLVIGDREETVMTGNDEEEEQQLVDQRDSFEARKERDDSPVSSQSAQFSNELDYIEEDEEDDPTPAAIRSPKPEKEVCSRSHKRVLEETSDRPEDVRELKKPRQEKSTSKTAGRGLSVTNNKQTSIVSFTAVMTSNGDDASAEMKETKSPHGRNQTEDGAPSGRVTRNGKSFATESVEVITGDLSNSLKTLSSHQDVAEVEEEDTPPQSQHSFDQYRCSNDKEELVNFKSVTHKSLSSSSTPQKSALWKPSANNSSSTKHERSASKPHGSKSKEVIEIDLTL